jgi:hypothetical protein
VDGRTAKRIRLGVSDPQAARSIVLAKSEAEPQPPLNWQLAKAFWRVT